MPGLKQGGVWGILGGTFDPVHYGHLTLAEEISKANHLTGVVFVPTSQHPFKHNRCEASFADRTAMLDIALKNYHNFVISNIEAEKKLSGYTYDTIKALKEQYPSADFKFIIGADNLTQVKKWHRYKELFDEVMFLAGTRPGYSPERPDYFPSDRIEYIQTKPVDISSSEVRRMLKSGTSGKVMGMFIPPAVMAYIEKRNLYR